MYEANHLASRLRSSSIDRDGSPFLRMQHRTISFGEFFANAERIAAALIRTGIRAGDRVAAQVPKSASALELYVGTVLAGGVYLPINPAFTHSELEYLLDDARPTVFVGGEDDTMEEAARRVPVVWTLSADETGTLLMHRDHEEPGFEVVERGSESLAAILYTSGTTGRPKGAMIPHRALSSNAMALVDVWRFTEDDVLIHALPIFHTHGLFVATNTCLMAGASMIYLPRFEPDHVVAAMRSATTLMGVPTYYARLLDTAGLADAAAGMRLFISGSAPLRAAIFDRWREVTGHEIVERYGMTETNMNTSNPVEGRRKAGTVGRPLPGVDLRIVDGENGDMLENGDTGAIEVRGLNLLRGYWGNQAGTDEAFSGDGFFSTGDLGQLDSDGYLRIVDRATDLIISGGYNIYPKEIERQIDAVDGVTESAVFGVPDEDLGEVAVAVAVVADGSDLESSDIIASISSNLARYKRPRAVRLVAELPRNAMGKVQKNLLRDLYSSIRD